MQFSLHLSLNCYCQSLAEFVTQENTDSHLLFYHKNALSVVSSEIESRSYDYDYVAI